MVENFTYLHIWVCEQQVEGRFNETVYSHPEAITKRKYFEEIRIIFSNIGEVVVMSKLTNIITSLSCKVL